MALERDKLGILKKVWGYKAFRSQQEEVIDRILDGKDTLVIMPTGGGKSLCFQLPALLMPGLTVVISPLIALMDDQVAALRSSGVPVEAMHSNIAQKECQSIEQNIYQGNVKILYVSPERATTSGFVQMLDRIDISLIAVDEAHCVSVWGNDFRPDYTKINIIRDRFDQVPFVALTATADSATQQDICNQLHLKTPQMFISSFERHNIYVEGRPAENRLKQIFEFLSAHPRQSGIIYCLSRRDTESLAQKLASKGFKCHYYHAGMTAQDRQLVQQNFQNDKVQFICATIAFGMGIDKGNIRWVIHYSMPKNLEG